VNPRATRRRFVLGGIAAGTGALAARRPRPLSAAPDPMAMPASVRAIYMNPLFIDESRLQGLLDLIDTTELNALVIDVKEDGIYVPTKVGLFVDAGEVDPSVLDTPALLAALRERGIYAIARVVTFRDAYIARERPDLAVMDALTGQPWQSYDGLTWLNPLKEELWAAYQEFAVELVNIGFDEIQFDYIRFPSDGDMTTLDVGVPLDEPLRASTIATFLGSCRDVIAPLGASTAADIFGYTLLVDDIGIGQNVALLAEQADVLCPMVYPSHYPDYSILVPGTPNDYPYEVVAISMTEGAKRTDPANLRPWLQDFSLAGMSDYGPAQVRAQIDAAIATGAGGWMLWAADSVFTATALASE
jgi:hypothetical protein